MVPTDPNTLIKKVALKTGFSEKVCAEIIHLYWNKVRQGMIRGKSPYVKIRNFGYLKASTKIIDRRINHYEKVLADIDNAKKPAFMLRYASWRISVLRKLQSIYLYENFIKRKIRKTRVGIFRNLKESEKNTGRVYQFLNQEEGD
jgi:nucleoid DNA-binding protein